MDQRLIDPRLRAVRLRVDDIVKELHGLATDVESGELASLAEELRGRLGEPFLFVIVGEVKAGKSSFVNALLRSPGDPADAPEIAESAPEPKTDTIQQIVYGEPERVRVHAHLTKIFAPIDILKEIAIVDTPGTNTIIEHHQEITERFIPASDLVVFVFDGKNPYRQSAWELFDRIHGDWRKKVIFVLQQVDLLTDEELRVNVAGVRKYGVERGEAEPKIFAVSAKRELHDEIDESGFQPLRHYIARHITGGQAPALKLDNDVQTSAQLLGRVDRILGARQEQLERDLAFQADVKATLAEQGERSARQVDVLVENLVAEYERSTGATRSQLRGGLGFFALTRRSFAGLFSKEASVREWMARVVSELETTLRDRLSQKLETGTGDLASAIHLMATKLDAKLGENRIGPPPGADPVFGQTADRRVVVLTELRERLGRFLQREERFLREDLVPEDVPLTTNLAGGGGIAAIGVALAALAQGAVFDITGGILTAVGVLFAGVTVSFRRGQLLRSFDEEVDRGKDALAHEVDDRLKGYVKGVSDRLEAHFRDFDALLEEEQATLSGFRERSEGVHARLDEASVTLVELQRPTPEGVREAAGDPP